MPVLLSLLPANSAWNGCLISFEWLFLSAQTICHYHVVKRALHKTKARKKNPVGAKYQFDSPHPTPPHPYPSTTKKHLLQNKAFTWNNIGSFHSNDGVCPNFFFYFNILCWLGW